MEPLASTSALPAFGVDTDTPLEREQPVSTAAEKGKGKAGDLPWWSAAFEVENKGSVARDHLANERTYLAWLRTSLSLASIGIAVTQLFRLSTNKTLPSIPSIAALSVFLSTDFTTSEALSIQQILAQHAARLDALDVSTQEAVRYRYLAKPVGGTFIALALVFLVLGSHRFFRNQTALMKSPSMFAPSRRSVIASTFFIAAISVASFAAIMSTA